MPSFWEVDATPLIADATVIGAGLVGLSTALFIKMAKPTWVVRVVETGPNPSGASVKNAGFACFGSAGELIDDLNQMPESEVWDTVAMRWNGLQELLNLHGTKPIDYQACGGWEGFRDPDVFKNVLAKLPELNDKLRPITGQNQVYSLRKPGDDGLFGSGMNHWIFNAFEGALHPVFLMQNLVQLCRSHGVELCFGMSVYGFEPCTHGWRLLLHHGIHMETAQMLVCTNGFTSTLIPDLDVKPARAQVLVTEPVPNLSWSGTFHADEGYYYFRNIGKRVLLGGGRNLDKPGETTMEPGINPKVEEGLNRFLKEVLFPNSEVPKIEFRWSGIMGMGEIKRPIIKTLQPGLHAGVRMGGMGIAIGTLVARQLSTMVAYPSEGKY
jgi:hypothetical protein